MKKTINVLIKSMLLIVCVGSLTGLTEDKKTTLGTRIKPEPSDWYAGDIHVHRDCGGPVNGILPESKFVEMMEVNDLAVTGLNATEDHTTPIMDSIITLARHINIFFST